MGALFGSFFNVCIYRIPRGVPLSVPPSHCYQCGQPIRWFDNIPLVSYWVLRGRCRHCRAPYSIRYFFVELLTASLFTLVFVRFWRPEANFSLAFVPGIIFVSLLIIETFTDIDHWIIPDRISLGGIAAGIAFAAVPVLAAAPHNPLARPFTIVQIPPEFDPLANSLTGAALGYSSLWLMAVIGTIVFRKDAMGQGDWKLFAMIGAFVGPLNCLYVLVIACFVGSFAGGLGVIIGRLRRNSISPAVAGLSQNHLRFTFLLDAYDLTPTEKYVVAGAFTSPGSVGPVRHHLPFGPSLAISALIVYLAWEWIDARFLDSPLWMQW
jgi:leader peptidase (prepilin peptidase)/N-methyltransferase